MRNNSYNDDRYDRRSRRGQDRFEPDYRTGTDWESNRHSYYGGRDRMDMEEDTDRNDDRYGYMNSRTGRSWSETGRRSDDDRWNDNYRYSSSRNGNRYDDNE